MIKILALVGLKLAVLGLIFSITMEIFISLPLWDKKSINSLFSLESFISQKKLQVVGIMSSINNKNRLNMKLVFVLPFLKGPQGWNIGIQ